MLTRVTWALFAVGLLCAPLVHGGHPEDPSPVADVDSAAVRAMLDQWGQDMATRGAEGFVAHFTDDGVLLPPKEPPVSGKKAVLAWLSLYFELHASRPESAEIDEIEASGDLAFVRYHTRGSYLVRATGEAVPYDQKCLDVLRRQPDGSWRVARHMWSSNSHLRSVWDDDWSKVEAPDGASDGSSNE